MKKLVVSTGAGISAESGLSTFRDAGGLWDKYPVMDVASHDGFVRNPALVHEFYNKRRRELQTVAPNAAHTGLKELEKLFDVRIITQNVDDLHERAGSSHVLHLHGELIFVVIGTSLNVYPAASLLYYARAGIPVYYIDPRPAPIPSGVGDVTVIAKKATEGVAELAELLKRQI